MKKILALVIPLILSACSMALQGPLPYRYVPTISDVPPLPLHLKIEKLQDGRPYPRSQASINPQIRVQSTSSLDDRELTKPIEPVDAQVTMALVEDFRSSGFFEGTNPTGFLKSRSLVLRGTILRFKWKDTNGLQYIPVINILALLGAPTYYNEAVVQLKVQIIDPGTEKVLAEYTKEETIKDSYTIYYYPTESGAELAQALKSVSHQIKTAIRADYMAGKFNAEDGSR